jgi:hypothetical protein
VNLPQPLPGWPWAVVEIASDADPGDRSGLIHAAYRSSRSGVVGLALHGVTRETVDRVLDTVVEARDVGLKGVVYLDAEDEPAMLAVASHAAVVIASTEGFRSQVGEWGIAAMGLRDCALFLGLPMATRSPSSPAPA